MSRIRAHVGTATLRGEPAPAAAGLGTRAAAFIERHVIGPVERTGPVGAAIAKAARNCGGCKADAARLDGDGTRGSAI